MYILGINAYHGDSSACILKNDEVIAASEEERFRRIKHWAGFPSEAIKFCLGEANIDITQVDYITISRDPSANIHKKILHAAKNLVSVKALKDRLANTKKVGSVKAELSKVFNIPEDQIKAEIRNIEHHRSHLASAFFASPFNEAAILSIDGFGDFTSTMIATGKGNKIEVLDTIIYPHSAGIFYTSLTQYLGFPHYGDEYKVMGLAPYGEPKYVDELKKIILFKENGLFELNTKYFKHAKEGVAMSWENGDPHIDSIFSEELEKLLGPARKNGEELTQKHKDIATSVQRVTEELIFHILNHLQKRTGLKNICIAGGVAQNSVANGKILEKTTFENVYIPSAGHDAGTALGSALWLYNHILENDRLPAIYNAYTGAKSTNEEVEACLKADNIEYTKYNDEELLEIVSNALVDGKVIGWFQGRAEFGPRALGHRSIIVDPRRTDAKELLNAKIKRRESFRPFAPSILEEYVSEYFEKTDKVPFMEKVYPIKKEKHAEIPAVTHVDGTGRLQTVEKGDRYYDLIERFRQKTGTPILLNTSFNENEPIVNTPKEALACYLRTEMDMLVMENCVVSRK
ncbi:MAG: carbamoyltransferase [Flavobacteriales bacterium]|nr:carbamoyltransferase [Flavobacteriales bacterium]MCW8937683.1 carbamoyltransferase [Flavobacteriales bacterium]MCW8967555.1 carbamoyltransferase [Flavobacteriales bacterium]MCW8990171.1 carbamoyltransferase [Flavobacteriales bacterium]MCW9019889.1 carbamoyltransferase [Flavobacteriales bacterium]